MNKFNYQNVISRIYLEICNQINSIKNPKNEKFPPDPPTIIYLYVQ